MGILGDVIMSVAMLVWQPRRPCRLAAWTLIELLVVVAIGTLVMTLILAAIVSARRASQAMRVASHVRQLNVGYGQATQQNKGRLLHGYTPPTLLGQVVTVRLNNGLEAGPPLSDRWPWRLWPYVHELWELLYSHLESPPALPETNDSASTAFFKAYSLSVSPGIGLNSCYLGGHHGPWQGFVAAGSSWRPNAGRHVAFDDNEIPRPSRQIVFAEVQARNAVSFGSGEGIFFLTPPRAAGQRWRADTNGRFEITVPYGQLVGLPEGRHGVGTPVGFYDGHVETLTPRDLDDSRLWFPKANNPNDDF